MLYSRASSKAVAGLTPHPCACCPTWFGSITCQHPHRGWHLGTDSQCSLAYGCLVSCLFPGLYPFRISSSFCPPWPKGSIFLAHTLSLPLPCSETCDSPGPSESNPSSSAWPSRSLPTSSATPSTPLASGLRSPSGSCSLLGLFSFVVCLMSYCLSQHSSGVRFSKK